jgi:hypothetical protein
MRASVLPPLGLRAFAPRLLSAYNYRSNEVRASLPIGVRHSFVFLQYALWLNANFTASELANPAISGDDADPDHDGLPNYLEYALGLNPKAAEPSLAPPLQIETVAGQPAATFTYTLNPNATGAVVTVQASTNLINWTTASALLLSQTNNGTHNTLKIQINPGQSLSDKLFLRLAASPLN